jgi:hypothetical protein
MQHEQINTNLFLSRKLKCIVPRHFYPAFRASGKPFRGHGKIPGRPGIKKQPVLEERWLILLPHLPMLRMHGSRMAAAASRPPRRGQLTEAALQHRRAASPSLHAALPHRSCIAAAAPNSIAL